MRPATLAEAIERIAGGEPREKAMPEFLDTFYLAPSAESRLRTLVDEPPITGDARIDALAGATAHYLAQQYKLPDVPEWVFGPARFLERPWHTTPIKSDAMREYLTFASPAEFRCRNIFTEELPLRRARTPIRTSEPPAQPAPSDAA
jgi:hypothetical protein